MVCLFYHFYSGYVKELMSELFTVFTAGKAAKSPTPDFLCSDFDRPNKKKAIKDKQTRFAKYNI